MQSKALYIFTPVSSSAFKAGYVTLIGLPNAGKSSLWNALIGEKLAAVTNKPQTTRHRIPGLIHGPGYQIILSDTPGVLDRVAYRLQERLMNYIYETLEDSDLFLLVYDASQTLQHHKALEQFRSHFTPNNSLVVLNKWDIAKPAVEQQIVSYWQKLPLVKTSVLTGLGLEEVKSWMIQHLPEHPPYYDTDSDLSTLSLRFFVSEIIREKIFLNYMDEVPYACHVEVDSYEEKPEIHRISATIYVERESQKAILIGHQGQALKKLGIQARQEIEALVGTQVFLSLTVKVAEGWRSQDRYLKKFGYFRAPI